MSSTTEATKRTTLEDEDDEEVVHVKMDAGPVQSTGLGSSSATSGNGIGAAVASKTAPAQEDDGELVEIQHEEMQGVETPTSGMTK